MESLKESVQQPPTTFKDATPVFLERDPMLDLVRIDEVVDHPVREYVERRLIPHALRKDLFYAPDFFSFTNTVIPDKFELDTMGGWPRERLVIPLRRMDGSLFGFQGRAIVDCEERMRYITVLVDKAYPRIYGLDRVAPDGDVYACEGPIDAMFLPNGIATAGGKITVELLKLEDRIDKSRVVVIYDNQPRNVHVVRNLYAAVESGYRVLVWPEGTQYKDVNEHVTREWGVLYPDGIRRLLEGNVLRGNSARLAIGRWKKT